MQERFLEDEEGFSMKTPPGLLVGKSAGGILEAVLIIEIVRLEVRLEVGVNVGRRAGDDMELEAENGRGVEVDSAPVEVTLVELTPGVAVVEGKGSLSSCVPGVTFFLNIRSAWVTSNADSC